MTVGHPLGGICAVPTNTAQTDIIVIDCLVNYNVNYSKPSFIYSLPPKEAIARFPSVMTRERRSRQGIRTGRSVNHTSSSLLLRQKQGTTRSERSDVMLRFYSEGGRAILSRRPPLLRRGPCPRTKSGGHELFLEELMVAAKGKGAKGA